MNKYNKNNKDSVFFYSTSSKIYILASFNFIDCLWLTNNMYAQNLFFQMLKHRFLFLIWQVPTGRLIDWLIVSKFLLSVETKGNSLLPTLYWLIQCTIPLIGNPIQAIREVQILDFAILNPIWLLAYFIMIQYLIYALS